MKLSNVNLVGLPEISCFGITQAYADIMTENDIPKLFVNADLGAAIKAWLGDL